jgi:hypothetical protein
MGGSYAGLSMEMNYQLHPLISATLHLIPFFQTHAWVNVNQQTENFGQNY